MHPEDLGRNLIPDSAYAGVDRILSAHR
jgi:hypothetical protein